MSHGSTRGSSSSRDQQKVVGVRRKKRSHKKSRKREGDSQRASRTASVESAEVRFSGSSSLVGKCGSVSRSRSRSHSSGPSEEEQWKGANWVSSPFTGSSRDSHSSNSGTSCSDGDSGTERAAWSNQAAVDGSGQAVHHRLKGSRSRHRRSRAHRPRDLFPKEHQFDHQGQEIHRLRKLVKKLNRQLTDRNVFISQLTGELCSVQEWVESLLQLDQEPGSNNGDSDTEQLLEALLNFQPAEHKAPSGSPTTTTTTTTTTSSSTSSASVSLSSSLSSRRRLSVQQRSFLEVHRRDHQQRQHPHHRSSSEQLPHRRRSPGSGSSPGTPPT